MKYINNELFLSYCDYMNNADKLSKNDKQTINDICTIINHSYEIIDQATICNVVNQYVDVAFDAETKTCAITLDNMPQSIKNELHKKADRIIKMANEEMSK